MIPADMLTAIAEGVVEKWQKTHSMPAPNGGETLMIFTTGELASFVEIVLACGAAHEEHQRKHGAR
jgi:hypothetical protein